MSISVLVADDSKLSRRSVIRSLPQDLDELNGKVLRMNLDGSIPADNPFGSSSYVYTYGHRNAQGLVLAPNGILYSSEHGPTTNDEFNIIIPGQNYGWPEVEGFCNQGWETSWCNSQSDYEDPIAIWSENATIAPSDLVWYDHPAIPEWDGKMLMTVLKNKHLKEIEVDMAGTSVVGETIWFQNTFQRLRDILVAPDGRVFLATSGNSWANSAPFTHSIVELKNSSYSPIGIEEGIVNVETKIYPNPSNGMTTISFPREMRGAEYRVVDFTGRVIANRQVTNLNTQLDFSGLASGLYTVQATKGKYATSERLILSK